MWKAKQRPARRRPIKRFKLTPADIPTEASLLDGTTYPSRRLAADEIRIFELRPGSFGQPIHGNVSIFHLDKSLDDEHLEWQEFCNFEALSYTWGPRLEGHTVRLNGCYDLAITDNLWYALQRLRGQYFWQHLWVDAIVINQNDDVEKGQQVSEMMTIYECAKRTLVWLGEPTRPALPGREMLVHTPDFVQEQYARAPEECVHPRGNKDAFYPHAIIRYTVGLPLHVADILTRRRDVSTLQDLEAALAATRTLWHTRPWIVQELVAAREVHFVVGPTQVEHAELYNNEYARRILGHIQRISPHTSTLSRNLEFLAIRRGVAHISAIPPDELLTLIYNFQTFDATDPRDRIYGLLGLMHKDQARLIKVDYGRPPGLVLAQATYAHIKMTGYFTALTEIRLNRTRDKDLPSWAFTCHFEGNLVPFPRPSISS